MSLTYLTFCTVSYRDEDLLALNYTLTQQVNAGMEYCWVIGENYPITNSFGIRDCGNITILPGSKGRHIPSYHHTTTLNSCVRSVESRYVCIIDPDFFVIEKDWVAQTLDHMDRNGLIFLGVPWHPKHFTKYRGFPCVHFMLIDLHRISREKLDFRPTKMDNLEAFYAKKQTRTGWLRRLTRVLLLNRWKIGREGDTGTRLYEMHSGADYFEVMKPVLFGNSLFKDQRLEKWNRWLDKFMPQGLRYRPEAGTFVSLEAGFFPSFKDDLWELFYWRGRPFGFHLRKYKRPQKLLSEDAVPELLDFLENFNPSIGNFRRKTL